MLKVPETMIEIWLNANKQNSLHKIKYSRKFPHTSVALPLPVLGFRSQKINRSAP